jgi:hypothetical protein
MSKLGAGSGFNRSYRRTLAGKLGYNGGISSMKPLRASQKAVGMVVLSAVWLLGTGRVWR